MDDYPASEPIPQPDNNRTDFQYHELMEFLTDNVDMRKTARSAMKQAAWSGGGAVFGGLLLGPIGGLVGGIAGSIIGFVKADQYDGAVQQLLQLEGARREQLMQAVGVVLKSAGASAIQFESPEAFRGALVEMATRRQVRDQLWQACLRAMED